VTRPKLKASIVVCSYNQGQYLEATLKSLLCQVGLAPGELEIILIDGGSTDNTPDIISLYRSKLEIVVSEPDQGQADALRKGFRMASGDVLGWLCSDDLLSCTTIREVLDYFEAFPEHAFVYGDATFIDAGGGVLEVKREIDWIRFIWLHDHNYIPQPSAFWRRDLYERAGEIDTGFEVCMDEDLFARFATLTRPQHVAKLWSSLRMYSGIKTFRLKKRLNEEHNLILARCGTVRSSTVCGFGLFLTAKGMRVWLRFRSRCYGDSLSAQLRALFSKDRWLRVLGFPQSGLGGD
jgi:glycosyltransferase involved in cell wall biosynthesis